MRLKICAGASKENSTRKKEHKKNWNLKWSATQSMHILVSLINHTGNPEKYCFLKLVLVYPSSFFIIVKTISDWQL